METSNQSAVEEIGRNLQTAWGFFKHLYGRYNRDGCRESAAALTYMTLFALVPLLTLMYSVFSLVPAFGELETRINDIIFRNFMPASGVEIQEYLLQFSDKARTLSAVGAGILIVNSYLMLANIEKTFNRIWDTAGNRSGLSGFLLYWGVLSLGPLLMGTGLAMHTYLASFKMIADSVEALGMTAIFLEYLPWLLTWLAFTLLFLAVPNSKVVTRYAVVGGLVTMIVFELAKSLFGAIVANSSFQTVYGAFAIVPLFLFWVYLCWMITLGGAELVRSLETFASAYRGFRLPGLMAMVLVFWLCWERQQKGKTMTDRDILASGIEQQQWLKLRDLLLKYRYLEVTRHNHYVLTRDISQVTLWQLVAMFGENFTRTATTAAHRRLGGYHWVDRLDELIADTGSRVRDDFSLTLGELFDQIDHSKQHE